MRTLKIKSSRLPLSLSPTRKTENSSALLMATKKMTTRVRRENVAACMKCPLCDKLLREATTISLCLHTFCKKCIHDKFSDDDVVSCPVCDISLGGIPVDKLRVDYNLQSLRAKVFPYKRKKENTPNVVHSTPSPVKIKERSLSSLAVRTQEVSVQGSFTGKSSKIIIKKRTALQGSSIDAVGEIKRRENFAKDIHPKKSAQKETQEHTLADLRSEEVKGQKADIWTPLTCLAEAINRSKSLKENSQGPSHVTLEQPNNNDGLLAFATKGNGGSSDTGTAEVYASGKKVKKRGRKRKEADERNGSDALPGCVKRKKMHAASQNEHILPQELGADDGANESRRNVPVWFSLVAAKDQEREVSLPQISSSYLRVKDDSVSISFIQKYLARKLNLSSESEVKVMCLGQPMLPTMQLHDLADLWFRSTSTSRRIPATVGAPADDFIMVLSYCRRVPAT